MGEVVILPGLTRLPIPVDRVLDGAKEFKLTQVLLLGYTPEGKLYAAASQPDGLLELAARFQHKWLAGDYDE